MEVQLTKAKTSDTFALVQLLSKLNTL
uniref:Uncharacterized protein n=1 Tax=Anguilla anguilla TaxID=7936 RepID=A0A0E9QSW0_ANGAN